METERGDERCSARRPVLVATTVSKDKIDGWPVPAAYSRVRDRLERDVGLCELGFLANVAAGEGAAAVGAPAVAAAAVARGMRAVAGIGIGGGAAAVVG